MFAPPRLLRSPRRPQPGQVVTGGNSPVGGPASATAMASVGGSAALPLPPLTAGQTFSSGVLFPASGLAGAGAMSAAYGGQGETLTYSVSADFTFNEPLTGDLMVDFLSSDSSGDGFDSLTLKVTDAGGVSLGDFAFGTLAQVQAFFNDNREDLGAFGMNGGTSVDLTMTLTASAANAGFGFTYDSFASPPGGGGSPTPVPEPSTWAMLLLGFGGLGWAGYRASRKAVAAG